MQHSLNHVFRLVWNHRLGTWCVAPEIARGKGKTKSGTQGHIPAPRQLWPLVLLLGSATAWAELPQGGQVSAGQGQLNYQGNNLHVQQHSDKLALDWQSFSVGKNNTVIFNQPDAQSVALNRVLGADVSRIQGAITANGQVFLLNPNGVLFSPTAQVNTGGLVASTLELSNDNFMAGHFQFEGDSSAAVTNQGEINVADGGTIALIAATIVNEGSLQATSGNVLMGAGRKVTLDMGGPVKLRVDEGALNTLIKQGGAIRADGGRVYLTAGAAGKLATSVINHTGITRAQTLATGEQGEIVLLGDMQQGQLQVAGTLDASAPAVEGKGGDGGFIETSAAKVQINDSVQVTTKAENGNTGEWLIDPTDFTINAGSAAQTDSGIGASTLSAQLAGSDITIETVDTGSEAGDMYVNGAVSWNADHTLSLNAHNNIHINEAITATNGGLTLNAGGNISADGAVNVGTFNLQRGDWSQLGGSLADFTAKDFRLNTANARFLRANGGDGSDGNAYQIFDLYGLQGIASHSLLSSHFALSYDIDASATAGWNGGAGFVPVGDGAIRYAGSFDGLGHTLSNLTIDRSRTDFVGLFGHTTSDSVIRNIGLVGGSVSGYENVGELVGYNSGTITNAYATGSVSGNEDVGKLVGYNLGTITNAYATGSVSGIFNVGELVGYNSGTITNAYATGSVSGNESVGGLVGYNSGTITNAYATGNVEGSDYVIGGLHTFYPSHIGGLVGQNWGTISNAYATVGVQYTAETSYVGGLVGYNYGTINNAYATGSVSGRIYIGGLVGYNLGTITNAYATGSVVGEFRTGGLTGSNINDGIINNSYWNTDTSGQASAVGEGSDAGTTGLTSAQIVQADSFTGWDIGGQGDTGTAWRIYEGHSAPLLRNFLTTLEVTGDSSVIYNGTEQAGTWSATGEYDANHIFGQVSGGGRNAGTYNIDMSGLYSGQQGYDLITTSDGTLTINKANLTVTAQNASKTYDGLAYSGGNGVSYNGFATGEDASVLSGTLTYGGNAQGAINAGDYILSVSGLTSNNYAINYVDGTLTIGKGVVDLMISAKDAFKVYDGEAWFGGNGVDVDGLAAGETLADLDGTLVWAGSAQGAVNAGDYTITASGLTSPNYDIRFNDGTLTIGQAPLTIAAQNVSKTYDGLAWASGNGVTYRGFVAGDNARVLSGTLTYGGSAQGAVNAGNYTLSASGLSSNNYNINFVDGTLTIDKANLTVAAQNASKTYDGQAWSGNNGVSYNGFVNGEEVSVLNGSLSWGGTAQGAVNAGNYTLLPSGLSSDNYNINFVDGALSIGKANLTAAAQDALWVQDGSSWSGGNGISYEGFIEGEDASMLNGTLSWGGSAQGAEMPGEYSLSASGLSDDNYQLTFIDGQLRIISPMEAAGQRYRDTVKQTQQLALNSTNNTELVNEHTQLKIIGTGILLP